MTHALDINAYSKADQARSTDLDANVVEGLNSVQGYYIQSQGESWYKIANSHLMPDFFVSQVSASDHWMFISSRGALSAGRKNPDSAIFPYYCADKLLDMAGSTGAKTIIRIPLPNHQHTFWHPFADSVTGDASIRRNLYKNELGNKLILEEIHGSFQLAFRYQWSFGNRFGFIRSSRLSNLSSSSRTVSFIDGIQNVMPYGLGRNFQLRFSNLGDAYKKNELVDGSTLGIYYLSSIPTDRAEPSEGLRATTVWQQGLDQPVVLLSSHQLERFERGQPLSTETNIRARRGAYFVSAEMDLVGNGEADWRILSDVNQDQTDVINLRRQITDSPSIASEIDQDIADNSDQLLAIVSAADGRQLGEDRLRVHRHQSNVLFNVMRGGIPSDGYLIDPVDLLSHIRNFSKSAFQRNLPLLNGLTGPCEFREVQRLVNQTNDPDLIRIVAEYLPFTFSRRHGDPTRPWNSFSIDLLAADGSQNLSYQGNWRDIFQNWEALSLSYPDFIGGVVLRFVNASTADGYNPYRLTKHGFDWESPDPNDPWANIGYWGDHQIIYLLKLLEWSRRFDPSRLTQWLDAEVGAYAQVPYRIRPFQDICRDPHNTIDYDHVLASQIEKRVEAIGADGKLLQGPGGGPCHVTLLEKLLVPALVKITNFVPEGGVWLNTQRPEWNDANNALVGRGLSMVTVCYMRRFLAFMVQWLSIDGVPESCLVSNDVAGLLKQVAAIVNQYSNAFNQPMSDQIRKQMVDALSTAGSDYRQHLYNNGLSEGKEAIVVSDCQEFFRQCLVMLDHTIRSNRRSDGLYHSYNLLSLDDNGACIQPLYEMLEGQVAVLSSGILSASEAVEVLDALRASKIYREDQRSYMLYPDRELPTFLEKNVIAATSVARSELIQRLIADGDTSVVRADVDGEVHFNGDFRNACQLAEALSILSKDEKYAELICQQRQRLYEIFEQTFSHSDFTGRSGTFFAYEGLGSIYWHMVSKLAHATIENVVSAKNASCDTSIIDRLHQHYREIRDGLGLNKSPDQYGAFPSDPYSHTPKHAGVQQPGMTGQVKEDILCRLTEIGVRIDGGILSFDPVLLETQEFLSADSELQFYNQHGHRTEIVVSAEEFAFTLCQIPVVYRRSSERQLTVHFATSESTTRESLSLNAEESASIFLRKGQITRIDVHFDPANCV
ncbi:hypothetical protein CA13_64720 [Planctomycetes bacterium CA13]|uniref:Uncharacterized protein n=1 Tax=Novipirellula herctigrandis TaxID=2527986 RepID=A0A5C5ZCU1_9BACT|nr:hypothetical protein CA13_64720 [Planctomycetes bacterium CA13]